MVLTINQTIALFAIYIIWISTFSFSHSTNTRESNLRREADTGFNENENQLALKMFQDGDLKGENQKNDGKTKRGESIMDSYLDIRTEEYRGKRDILPSETKAKDEIDIYEEFNVKRYDKNPSTRGISTKVPKWIHEIVGNQRLIKKMHEAVSNSYKNLNNVKGIAVCYDMASKSQKCYPLYKDFMKEHEVVDQVEEHIRDHGTKSMYDSDSLHEEENKSNRHFTYEQLNELTKKQSAKRSKNSDYSRTVRGSMEVLQNPITEPDAFRGQKIEQRQKEEVVVVKKEAFLLLIELLQSLPVLDVLSFEHWSSFTVFMFFSMFYTTIHISWTLSNYLYHVIETRFHTSAQRENEERIELVVPPRVPPNSLATDYPLPANNNQTVHVASTERENIRSVTEASEDSNATRVSQKLAKDKKVVRRRRPSRSQRVSQGSTVRRRND